MESERDRESLLEKALELPPEDRADYLKQACAGDIGLLSELTQLLECAPQAEAYFDRLRRASSSLVPRILESAEDQPPQPNDSLVGTTVSHYVVESSLGSGGMGVVFRATDTRLQRPVALKVLAPELTRDATARQRFVLEARAASSLDSQHICTIYDIGETPDGRTFMAMAYYEGETLREKLTHGSLPIDAATRYALQIGRGLQAAHLKGIVHRDIKPANVIITTDDVVKLLDFGLVKLADQALTEAGRALGTIAYMSPEQARGDDVDFRTDLWSVGAVLYEMLSARRPFTGDNSAVVLNAIQRYDPKPLEHLRPETPAWLVGVVQRLLAKNPHQRYTSADELCWALESPTASVFTPDRTKSESHPDQSAAVGTERSWDVRLRKLLAVATLAVRPPLKRRIAVIPFENRTGQNTLDAFGLMVADSLIEALLETEQLEVVPMMTVLGILKRSSDPESAMMDLVRRERTGTIVLGSFYRREDHIEIRSQTMNVRRRDVVGTTNPVRAPIGDPASGIVLVQDAVMIMLAEQFDPVRRLLGRVAGRPSNYDAYRAIVDSFAAMWDYDYDRAINECDRALTIDPTFSFAHIQAASVYVNTERYAEADARLRSAEERSEELSAANRRNIDLWRTVVDHGPAAALPLARRLFHNAPDTPGAMLLARIALDANRPGEAAAALRRFDPRSDRVLTLYWYTLVEAYLMLGRPRTALRIARRGRRLYPDDLTVLLTETIALAYLGRVVPVNERIDECIKLTDQHFSRGEVMQMAAMRLESAGQHQQALNIAERSVEWFRSRSIAKPDDHRIARSLALSLYLAQHLDEALDAFEKVARMNPGDYRVTGYRAAVALKLGDEELAAELEGELSAQPLPYLPGRATYWRARLAALRGQPERTVTLLRESFAGGQGALWTADGHILPIRLDPHLASLSGYEPFNRLVRPLG